MIWTVLKGGQSRQNEVNYLRGHSITTLVYQIDVQYEKKRAGGIFFLKINKRADQNKTVQGGILGRQFHAIGTLGYFGILWNTLEYFGIALGLLWDCFGNSLEYFVLDHE